MGSNFLATSKILKKSSLSKSFKERISLPKKLRIENLLVFLNISGHFLTDQESTNL
jgi:hypothetical protein